MLLANLRPLFPYLKKYRSSYLWGALCVFLMNGVWVLFPLVVGRAIDSLKTADASPRTLHLS